MSARRKKSLSERGIRLHLEQVLANFTKSIDDEEIKDIIRNKSIITGGCIASMLLGEAINDYDIYFTDLESALKITQYFVKRDLGDRSPPVSIKDITNIKGKDEQRVFCKMRSGMMRALHKDRKFSVRVLTSNAITLSDDVQLITRFAGSPDQIFENFDFVHCTNYYVSGTGEVVLRKEALHSLLAKRLIYHGSLYPIASIMRVRKFLDRGWTISAGQIVKMSLQLPGMEITKETLTEQLLGVDLWYMIQFLEKLDMKDGEAVDTAVISRLLDEVFDK